MAVMVVSGTLEGVDGVPIEVEVDLLRRLPSVVIVGLPGGAVRESADRVRSAIRQAGLEFPRKRVVVNLAPADVRKVGTGFDLPIAVGILAASEQVACDRLDGTVLFGELSLEGQLRRVRGALSLALMARRMGARRVLLPADNAAEAAIVEGVQVLGARDLAQVVAWLDGEADLPAATPELASQGEDSVPDLCEVHGQAQARRALEIAAAGGHNLLLMGSPGCGKTMLAARMPGILPRLSFDEAVDITQVWSVAGLLREGQGLVGRRPFRAPHHTISAAGMVGSASLRPGEVSLAHHGVLFLDEVPEFSRHVLELLRGPLEDRQITLDARGGDGAPASERRPGGCRQPLPLRLPGAPLPALYLSPGDRGTLPGPAVGPLARPHRPAGVGPARRPRVAGPRRYRARHRPGCEPASRPPASANGTGPRGWIRPPAAMPPCKATRSGRLRGPRARHCRFLRMRVIGCTCLHAPGPAP